MLMMHKFKNATLVKTSIPYLITKSPFMHHYLCTTLVHQFQISPILFLDTLLYHVLRNLICVIQVHTKHDFQGPEYRECSDQKLFS